MKLLLHTCCAPCLIFPLHFFRDKHIDVTGFFYNPNIHPYMEFQRRVNCLVEYAERHNVPVILDKKYGLVDFTRKVAFQEDRRCETCYDMRLEETARYAKEQNFSSFSTTLLYSRYQNHLSIMEKCKNLSTEYGVEFFYHDFREGWQQGIDSAIDEDLYRQPYCGCIYSEQERYDSSLRKTLKKENKG